MTNLVLAALFAAGLIHVTRGAPQANVVDGNQPPLPKEKDADLERATVFAGPLTDEDFSAGALLPDDNEDHGAAIYGSNEFEGDIAGVSQDGLERNAINTAYKKWTDNIVPYMISADFSAAERAVIAKAIQVYEDKTCIRFKGRTDEAGYIEIIKSSGCWSYVGRTGGKQQVSIGNGCAYVGIVLHEFMHAVGFWHEQSRTDRDQHVAIQWNNIQDGKVNNFKKYESHEIDDLSSPYDTCSIMHYRANSFSKNGSPTIRVLSEGTCSIGQRSQFSDIDIRKINTLYECSGYPQIGRCTNENSDRNCDYWAGKNYCNEQYVAYMSRNCKKSCDLC